MLICEEHSLYGREYGELKVSEYLEENHVTFVVVGLGPTVQGNYRFLAPQGRRREWDIGVYPMALYCTYKIQVVAWQIHKAQLI